LLAMLSINHRLYEVDLSHSRAIYIRHDMVFCFVYSQTNEK
jgi:hypothetical protein